VTTSGSIGDGRWATRLAVLLLLSCGFYGSYRAAHLAITNDEVGLLTCVHHAGYAQLLSGSDWDSRAHLLTALLAKPCVELLPLNEIAASRLASLIGLALFLWGVWRIGLEFPTGTSRVLITLALLSNAFLLDFFSLARGYGLAVGFTVLSLSFLMRASTANSSGNVLARRQAGASVWLAAGAALSNMGFLYFYAALLAVVIWVAWRDRLWITWAGSALLLGVIYLNRVAQARGKHLLYFGGDIGFIHDTVGSLVRASFYDRPIATGLVQLVSGALALLVLVLAYWSHRERISAAFTLSVLGTSVAVLCITAHELWNVKYPEERAALYLVPLVILIIGVVAARSQLRWVRFALWGLLLAMSGTGLRGANLSHTFTWRECADIPSALLVLRDVHQQTGQDVMVAMSGSKWTTWYYAEHMLGLHPELRQTDMSHLRAYDWLIVYEWTALQTFCSLPPDNPLLPGTTHMLLSLLNRDDQRLLATPLPGGLARLHFFPASDTTLVMLMKPQHQGAMTFPSGQRYVGEFKRAWMNGRGTYTWPDGHKYEGEFKDDKQDGQGTATSPDGQKYVGEFKDGKANGQGTSIWPDGTEYVGRYKDGKPDGLGRETWPDGRKYVGEFHEGQMDGAGKMTYPDGRVEDGFWKQGQFAGPALY
jgi:hypothetical protein